MLNGFVMGVNELMKPNRIPMPQKGFTLIEIMISLLLGAFLIGGVLQIFINSRETYRMQDALSRLQENGRFAMDFIGRDLRMADYKGCQNDSTQFVTTGGIRTGITGSDGAGNGANPDSPDTITAQWLEGNTCPLTIVNQRTVSYSIFPLPPAVPPAIWPPPGTVFELRRNDGAGAIPLIEGVENMQILYGVDTDTDKSPNYYSPTVAAANMQYVVSVRVSFLLYTTEDNVIDTSSTFPYNNEQAPANRRLRRVFTSTFALRNRVQ